MKTWIRGFLSAMMLLVLAGFCGAANPTAADVKATPTTPIYVVTNDDLGLPFQNSVDFYLAAGTQLTFQNTVPVGGFGIQGGFFGTSRISSIPSLSAPCLYVSNAASNNVASISLQTQQLVGNFSGSQTDDGSSNGIGLTVNANYLYASFTSSNTIGAFALQSGCGLTFLGDVPAIGLQGGSVSGMAVNGSILVVAYGDGSIQSFNVTGGLPVSNNDLQNSTGYTALNTCCWFAGPSMPSGVDITQDGRFAIFGDISATSTVEVSSLTTGKLATTVAYPLTSVQGMGVDAGAIRLSPDESLLYTANSESGTVTAAYFNPTTGKITRGCSSPTLQGFNGRPWLGSVVPRDSSGTGSLLYVAEFGRDGREINHGASSAIGILSITSNGAKCTLSEVSGSPLIVSYPGMLSVGVYPPRPF
jgi:6-phosphogluconolactonase (cycloisomerase 2 family)